MFRNSRKDPEELMIEVSYNSKLVLSAYTKTHKFETIEELKKYTKR
jgi:hypothetical protein